MPSSNTSAARPLWFASFMSRFLPGTGRGAGIGVGEQSGGAGDVGGGAVEEEVGALQGPAGVVLTEPATEHGVGRVDGDHLPADRVEPLDQVSPERRDVACVGIARHEPPAGAVDVVERPPVDRALDEQVPGVGRLGMHESGRGTGQIGDLDRFGADRRRHGGVACRGLVGVRDADHLAELHRELDDSPGVREALLLVRVEEGLGRLPGQDEVELPGEVAGVADPGAQPLSGERRHLVRGVAGQEDPPRPPLLGVAGLERVHRVPFEAGVAGMDIPRREQLPGPPFVVEFLERLAGELHELPPPAPGSARHGRRRPGRVADLQVERVVDTRFVEDHVDDQPVVEEPEVVHRQPKQ
jgi:hypothetical protein